VIKQGTDEWRRIRAGKLTASCVADATAKTKSGWSSSRANLLARLVCERLTGVPAEGYTNAAMEWGTAQEASARDLYAFVKDVTVEEVGFVEHPTIAMAGASPDGLTSDGGLVEIKCPSTAVHLKTLLGGPIDGGHFKQMMFQMACTNAWYCDYVSYDPRLPPELQLHIQRVERSEAEIAALEHGARAFLAEVEATVAELRAKFKLAA
jgi:putative phage-type endonuclease